LKILFDQGVPKPLRAFLPGHEVKRVYQLGWAEKKNGELLALAATAGFDVFVTTDQNLSRQQHLPKLKLAVFVLGQTNWPQLEPHAVQIAANIAAISRPGLYLFPLPPSS